MRGMHAVAMAMVALGLGAAPAAAVFDPATYAGTWSGTWKNTTFKVSGTFGATVTASPDGQTLTTAYTISNLFNCGGADDTRVLTKGVEFTDAGLGFAATNATEWGTTTVSSVDRKRFQKISMAGTPSCRSDISGYTLKAKLTAKRLTGKMIVTFAQGSPKKGRTTIKARKQ